MALVLVGCESRTERFDLSGTVTYQGKPVPTGYLVLSPDAQAGNRGPGATATISDGKYQTQEGSGTVGGPHLVTIFGFDGNGYVMAGGIANPMGKPLCRSEMRADLLRENGTYDFVVSPESR